MKPGPGRILSMGSMGIALAAALLWSWSHLADQREAALAATAEAQSCRELSRRIAMLRSSNSIARPETERQTELARQVATAAAGAGLDARAIDRIEHLAPRHSLDGAIVQKPTRIVLRPATLRQLITFLHALDRPGDGLRIERLHLTAPASAPDSRLWAAEATLLNTMPEEGRTPVPITMNP